MNDENRELEELAQAYLKAKYGTGFANMDEWPWKKTTDKPLQDKPLLLRMASGYVKPHDRLYITGFYNADWRPRAPWRDCRGDSLTDSVPEKDVAELEWVYLSDVTGGSQ